MAGRRLALPSLQVPQTLLLTRFPRVLPVACASVADCLRRVERGEAEAMTADVVSLALVLGSGGYTGLQIVGTAGDLRHERGVAVSPAQRPLVPLLQRALDATAVTDMPAIKQRWLERPPPQQLARSLLRRAAPWVLGALALLGLGWWWHSAGLRAEVARTQAARREAERAAAAANRFIAFLAHEVRNSLHSVIAAAELLRGEKGVAPTVTEPLGLSARSTLALLNGLLDRERLAAGGLTLDPGPARLGALVGAVLQEMGPAARLAGVNLQTLATPDPWLRVDALRVQQVLRNLVSNAIKYAGPGDVSIAWRLEGTDGVVIEVHDDGPGLTAEQRETLFQPYRSAGHNRPDSAGLGLALGRDLARTLGGDLVLETPAAGGVTAHFSFRAERLPEPAPAPARLRRALIVEDAEVYAMLLQRALEGAGWRVDVAGTVAAARAQLAAEPYELLLTDLYLPDGDAAAVLEAAVRPGLRRVVMTAEVDAQARGISGADLVLAKNADVQLFVDRLLDATASQAA
jgi:signal transduction histidine kinase